MKKPTLQQRLRYKFDNLMSKGTMSLLLILGIITAIVVVTGGVLAVVLGGADGTGAESSGETIWFTLMHAINTGVLAKEEGTVPYLAVMTVTRYVMTGEPVDFYTLGASAARYGEIAIGYKKIAEDGSFTIEVNPRSRAATKFSDHDDLIVVAV